MLPGAATDSANVVSDMLAALSNGHSGAPHSAEARIKLLERRMTGGRVGAPLSPRNLQHGSFAKMPRSEAPADSGHQNASDIVSRGVPESPAAQMTSAASSVAEDEASHGSFGVVVGPGPRNGNSGLGKKRKLGADDPGLPLHPYTSRQVTGMRVHSGQHAPAPYAAGDGGEAGKAAQAQACDQRAGKAGGGTPSSSSKQAAQRNTIQTYFNRRRSGSVDLEAAAPAGPSDADPSDAAGSMWRQHPAGQAGTSPQSADMSGLAAQRIAQLQAELTEAHAAAAAAAQAAQEGQEQLVSQQDTAARELERVRAEAATSVRQAAEHTARQLESVRQERHTAEARARALLKRMATGDTKLRRELSVIRLRLDGVRLGSIAYRRNGPLGVEEIWENGQAFADLAARIDAITEQREAIETERKAMRKRLPPPEPWATPTTRSRRSSAGAGAPSNNTMLQSAASISETDGFLSQPEYVARDEVFKVRLAALKREEDSIVKERDTLEMAKMRHIRELKRLKDEDDSRFSNCPMLPMAADARKPPRYLLCSLIGKGGFSDVYKALDFNDCREVAVKIHQLNSQWSEERKASYVRHAVREYEIHKKLQHPRVVQLLDLFEIDDNSFGTVQELCDGGDLDWHLKQHQTLPEKEARAIASQICAGLAYINSPPHRIIHYDLKPANVLFDQHGEVKLTDFGLSKIVDDGATQGMELTSQGAGTYWYLPPECFETGQRPPLITNKVDVWSLGVILYQMLLGRRPFGDGCTQTQLLRDQVMLNARAVSFPAKPAVSAEAKAFIQQCLAHRQQDRLDVESAAAHPYLLLKRPEQGSKTTRAGKDGGNAAALAS